MRRLFYSPKKRTRKNGMNLNQYASVARVIFTAKAQRR
jgi:hypothetical protein